MFRCSRRRVFVNIRAIHIKDRLGAGRVGVPVIAADPIGGLTAAHWINVIAIDIKHSRGASWIIVNVGSHVGIATKKVVVQLQSVVDCAAFFICSRL